ncbi:hypothetical protein [Methylophilus aquaticus]|uniref:Uncharacterized protein n=1 Tax=Methylophilus aquaticus TaxID=1971610 RepID=A0ABT9JVU1_9PROT|nr:hypothetical protein [Methylophilus aquaticus]MDP8568711.1 hypothetical protein [Methylophilus aquaticus]
MSFDVELKVGDIVRTFDDLRGTVTHLNYFKGELSSVTVRWLNGRVMTHPCTAEDIWLEGQPAKEDPDVKARKWFVAHEDEMHAQNLVLQHAYRLATRAAVDGLANIVWAPEPFDENASLDDLAQAIDGWSEIVKRLDGHAKEDLIKHDLFARECLHGLINGLKMQGVAIPSALLDKLVQADQFFIDHSIALAPPRLTGLNAVAPDSVVTVQDLDAFWYEYRWPKAET